MSRSGHADLLFRLVTTDKRKLSLAICRGTVRVVPVGLGQESAVPLSAAVHTFAGRYGGDPKRVLDGGQDWPYSLQVYQVDWVLRRDEGCEMYALDPDA